MYLVLRSDCDAKGDLHNKKEANSAAATPANQQAGLFFCFHRVKKNDHGVRGRALSETLRTDDWLAEIGMPIVKFYVYGTHETS